MKVLVAIAHYGSANRRWLEQLLAEYRNMSFDTDIVVLSEAHKELNQPVELQVGLPSKNPWSLPFAHRHLFRDRISEYDLFIYSEDDTLVTEENIRAFLGTNDVLQSDEIGGFLRIEIGRDGTSYVSTAHSFFRWIPSSVRRRGGKLFASYSNEHSAAYMATQKQLESALDSGGFLVPPHVGRYDMLVSGATDIYVQCGFEKLICIDELDQFLLRHLSNRYVGQIGQPLNLFRKQVEALKHIEAGTLPAFELIDPETSLPRGRFSKSYYELAEDDFLALVPSGTQSVLSIGCGAGLLEQTLISRGIRVTGIPLDAVIGSNAKVRGVQTIHGPLERADSDLEGERFDCVLVSNLLHLVPDPGRYLDLAHRVLNTRGLLVARIPNLLELGVRWRRFAGHAGYESLGAAFEQTGVHVLDKESLEKLLEEAGFKLAGFWPVDRRPLPSVFRRLLPSQLINREIHFVAAPR